MESRRSGRRPGEARPAADNWAAGSANMPREHGHRRLGRCRTRRSSVPRAICQRPPSTLDIMLAQEELWVYETLLKVIRNTNDIGPDQKHAELPETGQPQSGPHQANPGDGHRQGRRTELDQVREGRFSTAQRGRPAAADAGRLAMQPVAAPASGQNPGDPRWRAATSTTRASPCRTPPSSLSVNSA